MIILVFSPLSFSVSVSDQRLTVVLVEFPIFFSGLKLKTLVSTSGRYQVNWAARQVKTFFLLLLLKKKVYCLMKVCPSTAKIKNQHKTVFVSFEESSLQINSRVRDGHGLQYIRPGIYTPRWTGPDSRRGLTLRSAFHAITHDFWNVKLKIEIIVQQIQHLLLMALCALGG